MTVKAHRGNVHAKDFMRKIKRNIKKKIKIKTKIDKRSR